MHVSLDAATTEKLIKAAPTGAALTGSRVLLGRAWFEFAVPLGPDGDGADDKMNTSTDDAKSAHAHSHSGSSSASASAHTPAHTQTQTQTAAQQEDRRVMWSMKTQMPGTRLVPAEHCVVLFDCADPELALTLAPLNQHTGDDRGYGAGDVDGDGDTKIKTEPQTQAQTQTQTETEAKPKPAPAHARSLPKCASALVDFVGAYTNTRPCVLSRKGSRICLAKRVPLPVIPLPVRMHISLAWAAALPKMNAFPDPGPLGNVVAQNQRQKREMDDWALAMAQQPGLVWTRVGSSHHARGVENEAAQRHGTRGQTRNGDTEGRETQTPTPHTLALTQRVNERRLRFCA